MEKIITWEEELRMMKHHLDQLESVKTEYGKTNIIEIEDSIRIHIWQINYFQSQIKKLKREAIEKLNELQLEQRIRDREWVKKNFKIKNIRCAKCVNLEGVDDWYLTVLCKVKGSGVNPILPEDTMNCNEFVGRRPLGYYLKFFKKNVLKIGVGGEK